MKDRIPLTQALALTPNMTPLQVTNQWDSWSVEYPDEKSKLSPALVATMTILSTTIKAYDIVVNVVPAIEMAYDTAQKSYKAGLALLPGIGAVDGALTVVEEAKISLKVMVGELSKTLYEQAKSFIKILGTFDVSEDARL